MTDTNFTVRSGLPWARLIRVVDGKNLWPTLGSVEVRSQMRKFQSPTSVLKVNLHDFMTMAYGTGLNANDIEISWSMTGTQTAGISGAGYYDVVLSDTGTTDARGVVLIEGKIQFVEVTTKPSGTT